MNTLADVPYDYCPICEREHLPIDYYRRWIEEYRKIVKLPLMKIEYGTWVEILAKHEDNKT